MTTNTAAIVDDTPVVVHYEMTRAEIRAVAFSTLLRNPRLYLMPLSGVIFVLWGLSIRFGSGFDPSLGNLPIFFGLLDLSVLPIIALATLYKVSTLPEHSGGQDLAFSEWGVQMRSQRAEARMGWTAYRAAEERNRFYVLRSAVTRSCVFIPKRAFSSPADTARFRDLLARHTRCHLR